MGKAWAHFKTITYHKYLVMQGCFKVGLYKQGLLHDLSKYSPTEFLVGARYYQGDRSPNNAEREEIGYSSSWLHHKGRNKHHYEYWIDYSTKEIPGGMAPAPMPNQYITANNMIRVIRCAITKPVKNWRRFIRRPGKSWNFCCICWPRREKNILVGIFGSVF